MQAPTLEKDHVVMTLVGSIIIGLLLAIGFANGVRRGGIKEGTALIGVLLGALLVEFWAERWGQTLSDRSGLLTNNAFLLLSLALLIGTALFSGYGSGLFFPRRAMKGSERFGGGLLGLLNVGLLISFTLRYAQQYYYMETDPAQPVENWIRTGIASRFMLNWLGYVLLGAALALGIFSMVTAALRLGRLAATPRPPAKPAATGAKPQAGGGAPAKPQQAGGGQPQGQGLPAVGGGASSTAPAQGAAGGPVGGTRPPGQQESYLDRTRSGG
jgi:uncharacterized membrane protein required for colicin V production